MSQPNNRRPQPGGMDSQVIWVWVAITTVLVAAAVIYVTTHLGHAIAGDGVDVPSGLFEVLFGVLGGKVPWPGVWGWVILAVMGLVVATVAVLIGLRVRTWRGKRSRVDDAASYMGRGRDIEEISRKTVEAKAERMKVTGAPGVPIGRAVSTGQELLGSWEDMHVLIAGPRTQKTTSFAIPQILSAPGAGVVTSNKRDILDATRDVRAIGGQGWIFDPQGIAREEPTWYYDPLWYVTDELKAANLASHFASGSRPPGARPDAYFDPAGKDLVTDYLLAAALTNRPIAEVFDWLTKDRDDRRVEILADHGYPLNAARVEGILSEPDKMRGGVFGTARQMVSCLTSRQFAPWFSAQGSSDRRRPFSPEEFVRDGASTLYSLSREGEGTAGPLVTALTVAVVEAAEDLATQSANGRLEVPMVGVLDEAANVCRWKDLPDHYSHYGSRGIVLATILQSYAQGVEVWGEIGMRKLWTAANVKVYAGGVFEVAFLDEIARIIGDYDRKASSVSHGRGHRSVQEQLHRERILDVAELAALPKGRAVVMASGSRPTLIRTVPWWTGPHAEGVKASITAHDPSSTKTLEAVPVGVTAAAATAPSAAAEPTAIFAVNAGELP